MFFLKCDVVVTVNGILVHESVSICVCSVSLVKVLTQNTILGRALIPSFTFEILKSVSR